MSLFGKIKDAIFGGKAAAAPAQSAQPDPAAAATPAAAPPPQTISEVDVEAILNDLSAKSEQTLNWRTSIVDLLKLLDLDSSLAARKELAEELNVHAGEHGSAEQNIALSKAVWKKLAENGGQVPASLRD